MARAREEYRYNPIDTEPDVAVGIGLPFRGTNRVFNQTYTTEEQALSNLINLVLTKKGERIMQPAFGWGGWALVFEQASDDFGIKLETSFRRDVNYWLPYIKIKSVNVEVIENTVRMSSTVSVEPNGANRTITVNLSSGLVEIEG